MKSGLCILLCLVFITGCGAPSLRPVDTNLEKTWLSFIEDGKTTKAEILLKYGAPVKLFAKESILIYIMQPDETKGFINVSGSASREYPRGDYHFVFVFDEHNVLKNHSFLKVK
ncbi:MAG: hypothetical protein ACLP9S_08385 [Syntrophales bacterium]|jgi:hypothetical protein